VDERIREIQLVATMSYYLPPKNNEIMSLEGKYVGLEIILLMEETRNTRQVTDFLSYVDSRKKRDMKT
jgi:hypothetical protein